MLRSGTYAVLFDRGHQNALPRNERLRCVAFVLHHRPRYRGTPGGGPAGRVVGPNAASPPDGRWKGDIHEWHFFKPQLRAVAVFTTLAQDVTSC